jgi:hypothetical protein
MNLVLEVVITLPCTTSTGPGAKTVMQLFKDFEICSEGVRATLLLRQRLSAHVVHSGAAFSELL